VEGTTSPRTQENAKRGVLKCTTRRVQPDIWWNVCRVAVVVRPDSRRSLLAESRASRACARIITIHWTEFPDSMRIFHLLFGIQRATRRCWCKSASMDGVGRPGARAIGSGPVPANADLGARRTHSYFTTSFHKPQYFFALNRHPYAIPAWRARWIPTGIGPNRDHIVENTKPNAGVFWPRTTNISFSS
jgi:hypothetical protein